MKHAMDTLGLPCRFCGTELRDTFADLGMTPLCQNHIKREELNHAEVFYPLHAFVCRECKLVQLGEYVSPDEIFSDYAYFSSYSDTWLRHARNYTEKMTATLGLDGRSLVMEIASNDGYLLQYFVEKGIPVQGIEPAANVAAAAEEKGIPTTVAFFGRETARRLLEEHRAPNLLLGNNVLAHVPDLNDFVAGIKILLHPRGVLTMEFPHLVRLVEGNQFDTIYHEHFSYFSFTTVEKVFASHGITLFDVEELTTHGGSLRIHGRHSEDTEKAVTPAVETLKASEAEWGVASLERYHSFQEKVRSTKHAILEFLVRAKEEGKSIAGYGAPGKGNTLLNYCGIATDFLDYTVDRSPHKQGTFTPGTHIPIVAPETIRETKPDFVFILPWNLRDEIMEQMAFIRDWGGKFIVPIPEVTVYD
jgi:hypothetical protein